MIIETRRKNNHHNYSSSEMMIEHQPVEHYRKRDKKFAEDDFMSEFHNAGIVENYSMLDEKDEIYEVYDNAFKGRA